MSNKSPKNQFKTPGRNIGFSLPGISETPNIQSGGGGFFLTDVDVAQPK